MQQARDARRIRRHGKAGFDAHLVGFLEQIAILGAKSYQQKRTGENIPIPAFDLGFVELAQATPVDGGWPREARTRARTRLGHDIGQCHRREDRRLELRFVSAMDVLGAEIPIRNLGFVFNALSTQHLVNVRRKDGCRFAAQHFNELTLPFRRYHIGTVWRGENTQRGRYREFVQCDFDTIGTDGAVVADGAGTGSGSLSIEAERIEFGYGTFTQPSGVDDLGRLALGFTNVNLSASERITANNQGSLAVYQSQGAYVPGEGVSYSGGNLNILTPLLTGTAGSVAGRPTTADRKVVHGLVTPGVCGQEVCGAARGAHRGGTRYIAKAGQLRHSGSVIPADWWIDWTRVP